MSVVMLHRQPMTHPQTSYSQRSRGSRLSAALLSLIAITAAVPALGAEAIVRRGDAAVTGFSGAKVWGKVPQDVSPTDVTFSIPAVPRCASST